MKAVIFFCFLAVTVSFGKPTNEQVTTPKQTTIENVPPVDPKISKVTELSPKPASEVNATVDTKLNALPNVQPTKETNVGTAVPSENANAPKPTNENKTSEKKEESAKDNKVSEQTKTQAAEVKPEPSKTAAEVKPAEATTNDTKVEEAPANKETTIVSTPKSTPSSSESPKPQVTVKPTLQARGFDGASFVGGIILALGLLSIGFMGFKYYKNHTERNYHTL